MAVVYPRKQHYGRNTGRSEHSSGLRIPSCADPCRTGAADGGISRPCILPSRNTPNGQLDKCKGTRKDRYTHVQEKKQFTRVGFEGIGIWSTSSKSHEIITTPFKEVPTECTMLYLNIWKEICLIFFNILLSALTYIFQSYLKIICRSFLTSLLCKCHQELSGRRKSAGRIFCKLLHILFI